MRKTRQTDGERIVKDIKRKTRKQYSAEEKIRIVLEACAGKRVLQSSAAKKVLPRVFEAL